MKTKEHAFANITMHGYESTVKARELARDSISDWPTKQGDTTMEMSSMKVGYKFEATVRQVRNEGVYIVMTGDVGNGVISPRCWGCGERRKAALAAIHPGDKLRVVVKKFQPQTTTLVLALDGAGAESKDSGRAAARVCRPEGVYRKPDYKVIERGTLFLVDVANLFGDNVFEDAANALRTIREALVSRGYRAAFFLEHRAYTWLCCHQESDLKAEALRQFVKHESFSLVNGEADLGILQCARQIPNSVCLTNDHLNDYRAAFGEIVGTSRVRSFSWAKIDKCLYLSVNGLADAIVVRPKVEEPVLAEAKVDAEVQPSGECAPLFAETDYEAAPSRHCDAVRDEKMLRPAKPSGNMAILSLGRTMLEKGCAEKALVCFDKAARKGVADGYRAIAGAYATGDGVEKSDKKAAKYLKLAAKQERMARQRERRLARKMAMQCDAVDAKRQGHISARVAKAFRLAQFGGMHEFVREYLAARRPVRKSFRAA